MGALDTTPPVDPGASRGHRVPKYERVREALRQEFSTAPAGTLVPSEAELCEIHRVSRITVRRAVEDLIGEQVLARHHGRGTFVAGGEPLPGLAESIDLTGFHRQKTAEGHRVSSRVLVLGVVAAPFDIAAALGLPDRARVVRLDRLRSVDGSVDHLTREWFDAARYADLLEQDFSEQSLYAYLSTRHGLVPARNEVAVSVKRAIGDDARLLGLADGSPRLATQTTTYDDRGRPQIHGRNIYAEEAALTRFSVIAQYHRR
ncbi:GntR family transcriptional regulator [Rothia sp. AR01]|uniref:GntR family transcriptional regulator n=1 Tax=Rothia santali TaxID=2949643 RepID=A0A9X2HBU5_9MICC|nr:GntR family transcriptional regulator [Rothia santali]MCP3425370.1 GntR family transcriptional regulator [Rothia santali]